MKKICILGSGTWGTALARMLSLSGHEVTVWSAISFEIDFLNKERRHPKLDGIVIPEEIIFTKDMEESIAGKGIVIFAVPSVYVRSTAKAAAPYIKKYSINCIADVAKGLEPVTFMTMTDVIKSELEKAGIPESVSLVALSGPTHAEEVAKDLPTTIVAASKNTEAAKEIQCTFSTPAFRVYTNEDIFGVELCGALKNIIALAAGISEGLGNGDNAKAALITRGMAEISRLGLAAGCSEKTFYGLAGIGDLIVTATSRHSRNNNAGYLIGQGLSPEEAKEKVGMVVEGIYALPAATMFAKKYNIETPIINAVDAIINNGADARETVDLLMCRTMKSESHYNK